MCLWIYFGSLLNCIIFGGLGSEQLLLKLCDEIHLYSIRKTCPCDLYPITPHFYIVKLGFTGVYIFFLFLL